MSVLVIDVSTIIYPFSLGYTPAFLRLFYKSNGVTVTSVTFCKGVTDNEVTFWSNDAHL